MPGLRVLVLWSPARLATSTRAQGAGAAARRRVLLVTWGAGVERTRRPPRRAEPSAKDGPHSGARATL